MNTLYLAVGVWGLLFLGTVAWIALIQNVERKKDLPTNCIDLSERRKKKRKISI